VTPDQIIVTVGGLAAIGLVAWFFWFKRSVGVQAVDDVVADIEARLHERAEKEISSLELGDLVMEHLQKLDQVAYVRFASVYRQFKDIAQFMDEVKGLIKGKGGKVKS